MARSAFRGSRLSGALGFALLLTLPMLACEELAGSLLGEQEEAPAPDLLVAKVVLPETVERSATLARLLDQAKAAGVEPVALASALPDSPPRNRFLVEPASPALQKPAAAQMVTADYFRLMERHLLRGRPFAQADRGGPPVAIVNESMARQGWPEKDPLGQRLRATASLGPWLTVVGVIQDRPQVKGIPEVFVPLEQESYADSCRCWYLLARAAGDPAALEARLHEILRGVGLTQVEVRPLARPPASGCTESVASEPPTVAAIRNER